MASLRPPNKSERARFGLCGGWEKNCPFNFCDCFLFFWNLCVCVAVLKEGVSNIFVRSNFRETLLQGFKSFNVLLRVTALTIWHYICQHHPIFICCWPARATRVTELRSIFLGPCNSWSLTGVINSTVTAQIFNRFWMFVTNCFAAARNVAAARCL